MPDNEIDYSVTAWGKSKDNLVDLTVPSGQRCQVRKPDPQNLIALGILDNVDSLSGLVHKEHIARMAGKELELQDLTENPQAMKDVMAMMDDIVCYSVVQPRVVHTPKDSDIAGVPELSEGSVYVNDIDLEDKTFIMQYALGSSADLATFREKRKQAASGVVDVQKVPQKPKRRSGNRSSRN